MTDITDLAAEIATEAHKGQTRWDKKTPYISHPAAIAAALRDQGYNDQVIATAWLHDVIEDTDVTIEGLRSSEIPEGVLAAIDAITKRNGESYLDYILRVKRNEIARLVKIEDLKHNMSDLKPGSMYQKYQLASYILGGSDD